MVLLSIKPLKTFETRVLTPDSRLSAWAAAAIDSAYLAVAVGIQIYSFKFRIYFISSLTLG